MIVYWDLVIISTIIVNYAFLKTIALIFSTKIVWYRFLIAIILCVLTLGMFFIPYKLLFNMRYFLGILIIIVAFNTKNIYKLILFIVMFYLLNFTFIGAMASFKVNQLWIIGLTLLYTLVLFIVQNCASKVININKVAYNIAIKSCPKKMEAIIDNGNMSMYQGLPIVYLDNRHFNDTYLLLDEIEIDTVVGKGKIKVYSGLPLIIDKKEYHVIYAFCNLKEYDMNLNLKLLGGSND